MRPCQDANLSRPEIQVDRLRVLHLKARHLERLVRFDLPCRCDVEARSRRAAVGRQHGRKLAGIVWFHTRGADGHVVQDRVNPPSIRQEIRVRVWVVMQARVAVGRKEGRCRLGCRRRRTRGRKGLPSLRPREERDVGRATAVELRLGRTGGDGKGYGLLDALEVCHGFENEVGVLDDVGVNSALFGKRAEVRGLAEGIDVCRHGFERVGKFDFGVWIVEAERRGIQLLKDWLALGATQGCFVRLGFRRN